MVPRDGKGHSKGALTVDYCTPPYVAYHLCWHRYVAVDQCLYPHVPAMLNFMYFFFPGRRNATCDQIWRHCLSTNILHKSLLLHNHAASAFSMLDLTMSMLPQNNSPLDCLKGPTGASWHMLQGFRTLLSSPWYINLGRYAGSDWAEYYAVEPLSFKVI